jgi:hypothetical protein
MPFGAATVITNKGFAIASGRMIGASPSQAEPKFIGMGVGATGAGRTAAAGDTALSTEVESRTSGASSQVTQTQTNDTYQLTGTVTATATRAVDEAGTFDASTVGNIDISATFAVVNLSNGDSIAFTFKRKFA